MLAPRERVRFGALGRWSNRWAAARKGRDPSPRLVVAAEGVLFVLAVAVVTVAMLRVIAASGRGFDSSDEGLYLALIQAPRSYLRSVTGFHYLVHPLWVLVGKDVGRLRVVKALFLVAVHGWFARSLLAWMHDRAILRGQPGPSRLFGIVAGGSIIVAGFGAYTWAPQSFSYNDVASFLTIAIVSVTLDIVRKTWSSGAIRASGAALGVFGFCLLIAKWSSGLAIGGVTAVVVLPTIWAYKRTIEFLVSIVVGALAGAICFQLFVANLASVIRGTLGANRDVVVGGRSFSSLFRMYRDTANVTFGFTLKWMGWLAFFPVVCFLIERTWRKRAAHPGSITPADGLAAATVVIFVVVVVHNRLTLGSDYHVENVARLGASWLVLIGVFLVTALLATSVDRLTRDGAAGHDRPSWGEHSPFLLFALAPVLTAVGTGNPIMFNTIFVIATWVALFVVVVDAGPPGQRATRTIGTGVLVALSVVVLSQARDGLERAPYRLLTPLSQQSVRLGGTGPLRALRFDIASATYWRTMETSLRSAGVADGGTVIPYYENSGTLVLVNALGPGTGWIGGGWSAADLPSAAKNVTEYCRVARPQRLAIVLRSSVALPPPLSEALAGCGVKYPSEFTTVASVFNPSSGANDLVLKRTAA